MTKKIILIGNPIAGGGALRKIKKAVTILKNKGFNVNLMLTAQKGDAESFAKRISLETHNSELLVIAAGGDGTYNEVANGLVYSNIPMAVLPLGTTSVLAKEIGIPSNIEKALDVAINGTIQTIHIGRITLKDNARYFILMAGIGFDGEAVYGVNEKIKKYSGKGAYILSGLKAFSKYNPMPILIKAQGLPLTQLFSEKETKELQKLKGYAAIICKASCYGGNFKIAPDAKLTDQYFYVFVTHKNGRFNLLKYIEGIITGKHLAFKDISYFKTSEIVVEGNAHIQIDGDYLGTAPAKIEVKPYALKLVCSPKY